MYFVYRYYCTACNTILNMRNKSNETFNSVFSLEFKVKKEGWGGGGTRQLKFTQLDYGDREILKSNGKSLNVSIGPGLPSTTSRFLRVTIDR